MFEICQKCQSKPVVTSCIKGRFCLSCGKCCHFQERGSLQNHPFFYVNSSPNLINKALASHASSQSMSSLPTRQLSIPKRKSRVSMAIRMKTSKSMASFKSIPKTRVSFMAQELPQATELKFQGRKRLQSMSVQKTGEETSKLAQLVLDLKKNVQKKDQMIDHLQLVLKKQKKINKRIHQNYEEKLNILRKIGSK